MHNKFCTSSFFSPYPKKSLEVTFVTSILRYTEIEFRTSISKFGKVPDGQPWAARLTGSAAVGQAGATFGGCRVRVGEEQGAKAILRGPGSGASRRRSSESQQARSTARAAARVRAHAGQAGTWTRHRLPARPLLRPWGPFPTRSRKPAAAGPLVSATVTGGCQRAGQGLEACGRATRRISPRPGPGHGWVQ